MMLLAAGQQCVYTVPNGIPADRFPLRKEPPGGGRLRLLFVGQISREKGAWDLCRTLKYLMDLEPQVTLVYQNPAALDALRDYAQSIGVSQYIRWAGFLTPDDLSCEYRTADFLVLPSHFEVLPSVITEAMLSGTPVIATNVGGIAEQIGRWGWLVPPGDPERLAGAIRIGRGEIGRWNAKAARMYAADRFDSERMVLDHVEIYRALLGQSPRRSRVSRLSWRVTSWLAS
jgi:glycosyltransferase involved in cell wall biosynthesis